MHDIISAHMPQERTYINYSHNNRAYKLELPKSTQDSTRNGIIGQEAGIHTFTFQAPIEIISNYRLAANPAKRRTNQQHTNASEQFSQCALVIRVRHHAFHGIREVLPCHCVRRDAIQKERQQPWPCATTLGATDDSAGNESRFCERNMIAAGSPTVFSVMAKLASERRKWVPLLRKVSWFHGPSLPRQRPLT